MIEKAAGAKLRFEAASDDYTRSSSATDMMFFMLNAVAIFMGREAMEVVYGPEPESGDPADALAVLWSRLGPLELLFKDVADRHAPSSVASLRSELLAISNGDSPRLVKKIGRKVKIRADLIRLRALGWEVHLTKVLGLKAGVAQDMIKEGFGTETWIAIFQWKKKLAETLGPRAVERYLTTVAVGLDMHFAVVTHMELAPEAIRADGQELQAELRRSAAD
jgi:hypothetical protein